jgi:hypothetical protein
MPKIFGREPVLWLALVAVIVKIVSAFWIHVSDNQQAVINAVAAALVGLIVAWIVHDGVGAAVLGFAQAVVALAVGFGLHWSPEQQALVMTAVQILISMFDRTQVTAPVTAHALTQPRVIAVRDN